MEADRIKSLGFYSTKCVAATLSVFALSSLIHYDNIGWSLISAILVIAPEGRDTITIAVNRIKANVVGAGMGLVCLLVGSSTMWTMSLAVVLTLILCYLFNLEVATRAALAGAVIVMLHQEQGPLWSSAIDRVVAVLVGCALGLAVTFIFHAMARLVRWRGSFHENH